MKLFDFHLSCGRKFKRLAMNGLEEMLNSNEPVYVDNGCDSELHKAAILGMKDDLERLLRISNANIKDGNGRAPLHFAADTGIAGILIANNADVMARDVAGITPLHMAAAKGRSEIISLLISSGAEADDNKNIWKCTPLHVAAGYGHSCASETLISKGVDVHAIDSDGRTPLHAVAEKENYFPASEFWHIFEAFLREEEHGKFIELFSFISGAVICGHDDLVRMHHANLSEFDYDKACLWLQCRIEKKLVETFSMIVKAGAFIDVKDAFGRTPIHLTAMTGQKENVKCLLDNGAYINAIDNCNQSSLHLVESVDVAEILIGNGALPDIRDSEGRTPLHNAVLTGNYPMASLLIEAGCEPAPKDRQGITPLHLCASETKGIFRHIAECLIDGGAGVNSKDDAGQNPLHHASTMHMAKILLDKSADIKSVDYLGRTSLHTLARSECFKKAAQQLMHFLIDKGMDVNARDRAGNTPLLLARNHACACVLIQHGADIDAVDINGRGTSWSSHSRPEQP